MQTEPSQDDSMLDEKREIARSGWGGKRAGAGAKPRTQILRDIDRAARLYDIAESPYQKLAFGNCSIADLMRICARNLMEAGEFKAAGRLLTQLARQAKLEADAPRAPETAPGDRYELAVEDPPRREPAPPEPARDHLDPAALPRRAPPALQPIDTGPVSRQFLLASCALPVPDLGQPLHLATRRPPSLRPRAAGMT